MIHNRTLPRQLLYLLSLLLFPLVLLANQVTTRIDHTPIIAGETFNLIISATGQINTHSVESQKLTKNFIVLGLRNGSTVSTINGKITAKRQWIFTLAPKKQGTFIIPALDFGQFKSQPIKVIVQKGRSSDKQTANEDVFLDISVSNTEPYVQSQITYRLRLFYATDLATGDISPPHANHVLVKQLQKQDGQYQARRHGRVYSVLERNYVLFPEKSGTITIAPPIFKGIKDQRLSLSNFGNFQHQFNKSIHAIGKSIKLHIKPIPSSFTKQDWLPASQIKLTQTWDPKKQQHRTGNPISRIITLEAHSTNPENLPSFTFDDIDGVNIYPDKPQEQLFVNSKQQLIVKQIYKITYIPTQTGTINIPAVSVQWWNTKTEQVQTTTLSAKKLKILAAKNMQSTNTVLNQTKKQQAQKSGLTTTDKKNNITKTATQKIIKYQNYWPWIACLFFVLWLFSLFYKRKKNTPKQNNSQSDKIIITTTSSNKTASKPLKDALFNNDAKQSEAAILQWAHKNWPKNSPKSLGELIKIIEPGNLADELTRLNHDLYGNDANTWQNGKILWQALKQYKKNKSSFNNHDDDLPPLYPSS